MDAPKETVPVETSLRPPKRRPFGILIANADPKRRAALSAALQKEHRLIYEAACIADARRILKGFPIDLAVTDTQLRGGCGLILSESLQRRGIRTILTCRKPQLAEAISAVRVGAMDLLPEPLDWTLLQGRVGEALRAVTDAAHRHRKERRLKKLCRRLSQERRAARRQVDQLCGDLVEAYHKLAERVDHHRGLDALRQRVDGRLEIEPLLRAVLDFVLERVGNTNAVLFLPARDGRFTAGAYINLSFAPDAVRPMLDDLADRVAPRGADLGRSLSLSSPEAIRAWMSHEACPWLDDMQAVVTPCRDAEETLAVMMLFRETAEPLGADVVEVADAVAPFLADRLHTLLSVHHRLGGLGEGPSSDRHPRRF